MLLQSAYIKMSSIYVCKRSSALWRPLEAPHSALPPFAAPNEKRRMREKKKREPPPLWVRDFLSASHQSQRSARPVLSSACLCAVRAREKIYIEEGVFSSRRLDINLFKKKCAKNSLNFFFEILFFSWGSKLLRKKERNVRKIEMPACFRDSLC